MKQEDLFAMAIGVKLPWFIEDINLDEDKGELNININFKTGSEFEYLDENSGEIKKYKAYDTSIKTWRHMNFFQYRCYLHARVPRVDIGEGKVKQVKTPWEGISSGFTLLFEALLLQFAKSMTVHQICEMVGSYDAKIWNMFHNYTNTCREMSDYSKVEKVGMDETAARRGHDYITLFVDLEERKTLFVAVGKGSETVKEFVKDLEAHGGDARRIKEASIDMSPAFIKGVNKELENAEITFDKFHVIKVLNEGVDSVRREESKENSILNGSRYVFIKNQENHTKTQKAKFEEIKMSAIHCKSYKSMQIREAFQLLYQSKDEKTFVILYKKWYFWATHCRIPQMINAAKTINRHKEGIFTWAKSKISNGILEGFNSIFQAAKAKARGYKNTETIKTVIYLLTAKLDFSKVNRFCATHTLL